MVPLSTLGSLKPIVGPETVPHYNNYASALINGAAAPGFSSGQAVAAMERAAATALPRDFSFEWTGITLQELKAGSIASVVFGLAIVFVFLILAAQYESWSMPFMVLLAVPLALFGALLALWLRGRQIDVYSQIGFVMLIGLAAKNAILIVEFAKRRREEGLGIVEAATEAARLRLRPILMTAFAFILGVVPLMLATGAGAASRQSIGTTVFGGMLAATILSLLCVPVFYAVIEQLRDRRASKDAAAGRGLEDNSTSRIGADAMRHWKTGVGVVAALAVSAAAVSVIRHNGGSMGGAARAEAAPPAFVMPVPVVSVVKKPMPVYREYTARTEAIRSISILPRISGYIQKQDTADGADVHEGDLLYTIDPRDVQAALDQVKAQMQRDKAALEYARSNLNRGAALVGNGFLAKDAYDQRMSASGQAEAVLGMDEAALRTAELNLSYTQVRAPFAGRLGRNQASVGTLVSPGGSALNTLVQLEPDLRHLQSERNRPRGDRAGEGDGKGDG